MRHRFPAVALLLLVLCSARPASAEDFQIQLTELTDIHRWERHWDGFAYTNEEGGPVSTTFQLPEDVAAIQSLTVILVGHVYAGELVGPCEPTCEGEPWYETMPFHVETDCFHVVHDQPDGPMIAGYEITGCDFSTLLGAEQTITVWIEPVTSTPGAWWSPDPRVQVNALYLNFEVDRTVDTPPEAWGTLKARWTPAR